MQSWFPDAKGRRDLPRDLHGPDGPIVAAVRPRKNSACNPGRQQGAHRWSRNSASMIWPDRLAAFGHSLVSRVPGIRPLACRDDGAVLRGRHRSDERGAQRGFTGRTKPAERLAPKRPVPEDRLSSEKPDQQCRPQRSSPTGDVPRRAAFVPTNPLLASFATLHRICRSIGAHRRGWRARSFPIHPLARPRLAVGLLCRPLAFGVWARDQAHRQFVGCRLP